MRFPRDDSPLKRVSANVFCLARSLAVVVEMELKEFLMESFSVKSVRSCILVVEVAELTCLSHASALVFVLQILQVK